MAVGVYVRVSTVGQNAAGQKREIQRWLEGNGVENASWFVDKSTGNNLNRPAFEGLQKADFNGEIKTIVVWKLDRLSRSSQDLPQDVIVVLAQQGRGGSNLSRGVAQSPGHSRFSAGGFHRFHVGPGQDRRTVRSRNKEQRMSTRLELAQR